MGVCVHECACVLFTWVRAYSALFKTFVAVMRVSE